MSRFESGETDIQLPTVLSIFSVLGMTDQRVLVFPEPKPFFDTHRDVVIFFGKDGDKKVSCAISREALEDHFNANDKDILKVFSQNQSYIEHQARRKYLSQLLENDGSVLVKSEDLD